MQSKSKTGLEMIERLLSAVGACVIVLLLCACASSGPVPVGKETYMITKQSSTGFHSGSSVKADIYREASEFCNRQGMQLQPVRESSKDGAPGYSFANAEIVFRCLSENDRDVNRPTLKPTPNLIIENRNR